jgi:hypothetical protein
VANQYTLSASQVQAISDIDYTWYGLGNSYNAKYLQWNLYWTNDTDKDLIYIQKCLDQYSMTETQFGWFSKAMSWHTQQFLFDGMTTFMNGQDLIYGY